jgi:large subunit ribosomal protein L30
MYYRIRAIRSTIGLPKAMKDRCQALGLRRRGAVVYQPVNPAIAGQILSVKELVNVQLVDKALTRQEEQALRKSPKGYTVEESI